MSRDDVGRLVARFICRWRGHAWIKPPHTYKRHCSRCDRRETLFWKRYTAFSEPAYVWKGEDFRGGWALRPASARQPGPEGETPKTHPPSGEQ